MPGMASAHSHAFQRALRGRTQRRATAAASFWSWRGLMYGLVERLDPQDVYHIARLAYAELAMSGVTAVGEFHYLHHDRDGTPYANTTEMADAVIRAAQDVGIRICLIRAAYLRGGFGQPLKAAQQRFVDRSVERVLDDLTSLGRRYAGDPTVTVALAAHSVRTVDLAAIRTLADHAEQADLPFHMHICEQRREVEECRAEHGTTPVALLAEHGILSPRFVAVHATHLEEGEIRALGAARVTVCICRSTERDLGDGLPPTSDLVRAGVRLCVGVDSHAGGDAFAEVRALEEDERSRREARHVVGEAPDLLAAATRHGYGALGLAAHWQADSVRLDGADPSLAGIPSDLLADGIIFGATPRAVREVRVGGRLVVEGGRHVAYDEIRRNYEQTLVRLGW